MGKPYKQASGQGVWFCWWVPYRGQHVICELSYLTEARFDLRKDFSI